ncbi:ribonuclease H-like domain, reverse transcriptase, RNA-dependent DNA polymerase [Tanacetum coccineum]|uniref:Ribonuclease H-like domain, reverse transcriptase, RNA-dependent DNA polymerase n=1 Tax=Tanacetum coccineum TaxID=301880 RepID=A0ABQ5JDS0_9ASTR
MEEQTSLPMTKSLKIIVALCMIITIMIILNELSKGVNPLQADGFESYSVIESNNGIRVLVWNIYKKNSTKKNLHQQEINLVLLLLLLLRLPNNAARRNQERVKSILLLAIPDEHLFKFHNVADAKSLWEAIKSRFSDYHHYGDIKQAHDEIDIVMDLYNNLGFMNLTPSLHNQNKKIPTVLTGMRFSAAMDGDDLEELDLRNKALCFENVNLEGIKEEDLHGDNGRSNAQTTESSSQALVAQDGLGGYDWSNDFEVEPVNYALMASPLQAHSVLLTAMVQKMGYEIALESLESRILGHEKNELAWGKEMSWKDKNCKRWEESTKNLDEILNSEMSARDKTGLGYSTQLKELSSNHETDSENSLSIFDVRSSDEENTSENDKFLKNRDRVIIEDWNSDDEDEEFEVQTVRPETQTVKTRDEKSGLHRPSVSTARPVCTVKPNVSTAKPSVSTARPVCTAKPNVSTARPVYATRPIYPRMDNVIPKGSCSLSRGNPEILLQDDAVVDSGYSSHMTGNKAYLSDYGNFFTQKAFVAFWKVFLKEKNSLLFTEYWMPYLVLRFSLLIEEHLSFLGHIVGKFDDGYLLGLLTSSKAFRVYNKRTKRVEENLHINFLEDQPNVTGTGPNWMFDLDFLTNSMNYIPVSVENQVNGDCRYTDSYVAAHEKPSESSPKENDVQDSEDAANKESEQDLQDELEKMVTQELAAKAMDDVSRQAFEEEKRRIASQKKAAQATSTNKLSTDRPSVSTDRPSVSTDRPSVSTDRPFVSTDRSNTPYVSAASTPTGANAGESSFVYLGGKIPIDASTLPNADLPIDPNMPDKDASNTLPNDWIIFNAIHKDHPKGQILGDPTSAVQTRGKIQKASSAQQALVSYIYKQNRTNHKDHQNCLFACFLSQEEPKTISQALQDESWVEAMQEELLQFKLQKVWVLVDLPYGKKVIGTKWVFRNKRDLEEVLLVKNKARL